MNFDRPKSSQRKRIRDLSPRSRQKRREQNRIRAKRLCQLRSQGIVESIQTSESETDIEFPDEEFDGSGDNEAPLNPYNFGINSADHVEVTTVPVSFLGPSTQVQRDNIHSEPDEETLTHFQQLKREICDAIASKKAKHNISDNGIDAIIKEIFSRWQDIDVLLRNKVLSKSYRHSIRPEALKFTPTVFIDMHVDEILPDGKVHRLVFKGLSALNKDKLNDRGNLTRELVRIEGYTTLSEIKRFHMFVHKKLGIPKKDIQSSMRLIHVGVDGVQESKYGKKTFIIVTLRFPMCGSVYLWRILQPKIGDVENKPTAEEILRNVVEEVNQDPDTFIEYVLADGVERHLLKGLVSCIGQWSCEFCVVKGKTRARGNVFFPAKSSVNKSFRDFSKAKDIALNSLNEAPEVRQGIVSYTPLYDLFPHQDLLWLLPLDEMHLCALGVCKKMIIRRYQKVKTKASKLEWKKICRVMKNTQVIEEHSANLKDFSVKNAKASDFNFIQFNIFPVIVSEIITGTTGKELQVRKAMALYCFLIRLYYHSDEVLLQVEEELNIRDLHDDFYVAFEKGFCAPKDVLIGDKSDPVIHQFYHLYESRKRTGPLWMTSTEDFESTYAVTRRCSDPRTVDTPKQTLENHYMHLKYNHRCGGRTRNFLKFSCSPTSNKNDANVYACGNGYRLIQKLNACELDKFLNEGLKEVSRKSSSDDQAFLAREMSLSPYRTPCALRLNLPWQTVGVFRFHGLCGDEFILYRSSISCKMIICERFAITVYSEWLGSKYEK